MSGLWLAASPGLACVTPPGGFGVVHDDSLTLCVAPSQNRHRPLPFYQQANRVERQIEASADQFYYLCSPGFNFLTSSPDPVAFPQGIMLENILEVFKNSAPVCSYITGKL